jgi:hypothetical protein
VVLHPPAIEHLQELGYQIARKTLDSINPWQWTATVEPL